MFKGNSDGDTVHKNEFDIPIIAQWIRINPTRWRDRISLRVELFGCDYGTYTLNIISFHQEKLIKTLFYFSRFRQFIFQRYRISEIRFNERSDIGLEGKYQI